VLASLGYHDYEGVAVNPDEKPRLVRDLGTNRTLMLRNHGLLTVGPTVADAFVAMYFAEAACMIQLRAQAGGSSLRRVPQPILDGIMAQAQPASRDSGMDQLVWPGLLRRLDRVLPGYAA
jgi:ribulose-5-phosphate 4-epimerase/fuculose-1-phosphate aldolase